MASLNFFESFAEALAEGKHDLDSDTLKVYLTNNAPSASADAVKADLAEVSSGNGYTTGGTAVVIDSSSQTGGIYTLEIDGTITWVATDGQIGPFRYAVLYNDSAPNDELIGWWDYGSDITLEHSQIFSVSVSGAAIQITEAA